jgi:hypothetical protein
MTVHMYRPHAALGPDLANFSFVVIPTTIHFTISMLRPRFASTSDTVKSPIGRYHQRHSYHVLELIKLLNSALAFWTLSADLPTRIL